MRRLSSVLAFTAAGLVLTFAEPTTAEVKPAKGQSTEQMQQDIAACQASATQSSGYDPSAPPPPPPSDTNERGGRVRGAAAGAAASAAVAEVRGRDHDAYDNLSDDAKQEYRRNEAKEGAAAGAVVGGSKQRRDRRDTRRDEKEQTANAEAAKKSYDQANQSCLTGRGYTVTP